MKKRFNLDNNGGTILLLLILVCVGISIIIGSIISYILYIKKKKRLAIIPIIAIIFVIIFNGWYYQWYWSQPNELSYEVVIQTNTTDGYVLYLPYIDNSKLESEIRIISGVGSLDFFNVTEKEILSSNRTIIISGNGNLTLYGEAEDHYVENRMSLESSECDFINCFLVWCDKTNLNQSISISIEARIDYNDDVFYWGNENIILEDGWNKIEL